MQVYETVLILKPVLSDPEVAEVVEKTKKSISSDGGEIISQEIWGRRKLTHMIGKARDGVYAYFKYKSTPALLTKLNHNFAISDNVIRNMTVVAQDRKMREKKKKAKAPAAAAQA
jgi:small subunit ribosomal protein S6